MRIPLLLATGLLLTGLNTSAQIHDPRALAADPTVATTPIAPRLSGLGDYQRPVTSRSEDSAYFFNQGLRLTYAFNHSEALRAFKEAIRLDPDNAMGYWGWALVLGPNLNLPMQPELNASAYNAIQRALELKGGASDIEAAFIDALASRYTADAPADRAGLDAAYAEAMTALYARYPEDPDVATLYAAAVMNLSPWNYWFPDGVPYPRTEKVHAALQSALVQVPDHPGALHYYIHSVEAQRPQDGVAAADTLRGLMPSAGHMVHMPSHIYMRVGRYQDGYDINIAASAADEDYIAQCRAQGLYPVGYYPHNLHFLVWAATLQGRSATALEHARKMQHDMPAFLDLKGDVPRAVQGDAWRIHEHFMSQTLYTLVRFGRWDAILKESPPPETARYMTGIYHYARGMALANTRQLEAARAELDLLSGIADEDEMTDYWINASPAPALLTIAAELLDADLAAADGNLDRSIALLEKAVRLQDSLAYTEPPDWYFPTRDFLGAALLDAGRATEAEAVYWADLRKNPDNGFALFGLVQTLESQGRASEAAAVKDRFEAAWPTADVKLASSRY